MARTLVGWQDAHYLLNTTTNRPLVNTAIDVQDLATGAPVTDLQPPDGYDGQPFPAGQARSDGDGYYGFTVAEGQGPVRVRVAADPARNLAAGEWLTPVGQALANGPLLGKGEASNTYLTRVPPFTGRGLALAERVSAPFDILGLGDSLFSGQGVSSKYHRWPNRMLDRLRTLFPVPDVPGGFGYIPAKYVHATPANQGWLYTGFTAGANTYGLARQSMTLGPDQGAGAGTATITMDCTGFTASFRRVGNDAFTIAIDGSVVYTATPGPVGLEEWSSDVLASGPHTVVVTETAGAVCFNGAMFYNGDETKGIRYWDGAQSGTRADQFNAADGGKSEWADNIGTLVTPDLILVEWITNDYINRTPAQFQTSLENIRELLRSKTTAPILWVAPYERLTTGFGGATWAEYVAAMETVAAADSDSDFFNASDYVPRLSPDTYGALVDGTHPTDKFAAYLGELLGDYIARTWVRAA